MSRAIRIGVSATIAAIICTIICGDFILPLSGVLYGTPVAPFEFPELVRIYQCRHQLEWTRCTGAILNRHWIITSAFCFTEPQYRLRNYSEFIVVVGDHNSSVREPSEQILTIVEVVLQNNFRKSRPVDFDISLVRVEPAIKFGPRVRPTNLPACKQSPSPGTELTLAGYGRTKNYARYNYSQVPTKAKVTLLTYEECLKQSDANYSFPPITKYSLCSSNMMGISGPCGGDAGAPLFHINEKDGSRTQLGQGSGISGASFGRCDNRSFIYTDLAPFVGWIHRRISTCGNNPTNKRFKYDDPKFKCDKFDSREVEDL